MKREASIEALLSRANQAFLALKSEYASSLHEKHIREDLKVSIKNIFKNLRSCLDYMAQDVFDSLCSTTKKQDRLYFPIRQTQSEFILAVKKDFPDLQKTSTAVHEMLEKIQPYNDPWLGQFNKLNNENKHQDLVEQTRTEARRVTVSRGGGSVSWGPGVTFGSGVSVMGGPIDPRTQMPVPNSAANTKVVTWVDFRFKEINQPVLPFIEASLRNVGKLFRQLMPHI